MDRNDPRDESQFGINEEKEEKERRCPEISE